MGKLGEVAARLMALSALAARAGYLGLERGGGVKLIWALAAVSAVVEMLAGLMAL